MKEMRKMLWLACLTSVLLFGAITAAFGTGTEESVGAEATVSTEETTGPEETVAAEESVEEVPAEEFVAETEEPAEE